MDRRITEITDSMTSFNKKLYNKSEVLSELFSLQSELVNLTFNDEHAGNARLIIPDVESHFDKLNADCGHVADEKLEKFKAGCRIVTNSIKAETSGKAGECKAYRSLDTLRCENIIIKNAEFKLDDHRTELDAIVITEKAVFIVEVKNPGRDIYIDERGNYCRVLESTLASDKNIGEKMNDKEYLLREALKAGGFENVNIVSLVVFTNSSMHVENRYPYITACYLSDLPHKICGYVGDRLYSEEVMAQMAEAVRNNECREEYPMPIDMQEFKRDFAILMATLEEARENGCELPEINVADIPGDEPEQNGNLSGKRAAFAEWIKSHRKTVSAVTSLGVALGAVAGAALILKRKNR